MNRRMFLMVTTAAGAILSLIQPKEVEGSNLLWGTYGKSGKEPFREVKLKDCETDHLQAILRTESWHLPDNYDQAIRRILASRGVEPLPRNQCRTTR